MNNAYVMMREFIYGWDFTEFDQYGKVLMYYSNTVAQQSLADYVKDVDYAFAIGNMDEPYQDDCKIVVVTEDILNRIVEYNKTI